MQNSRYVFVILHLEKMEVFVLTNFLYVLKTTGIYENQESCFLQDPSFLLTTRHALVYGIVLDGWPLSPECLIHRQIPA
jgi:hypothetical protein